MNRTSRLKKLLDVQGQLKALHEMRHAGHLAEAIKAQEEAVEIASRFDQEGSLSMVLPEVYHRRISNALQREQEERAKAAEEMRQVAAANARMNAVEREFKASQAWDERQAEDKERLEAVSVRFGGGQS